ncbi:alpha-2-macroglobulin family protein [Amaricoccus sp.]|uniref:alpha-2-macroglobulin family protein n=1 Tax=Amaricoccus sp. TaxID=1872485 RepID=UPI001B3EC830|nr:alpha-2-macroglobulin family protein [Amaricoccus sp.]MBP7003342.1 alpha-2-macroglobulin family protein [Amaricoccus sp.]
MRIGGHSRRGLAAVRAAALLCLAALGVGPALAQQATLPERRVVAESGVDFYGGDLRSIYATTLPLCVDACLADTSCKALTFNLSASACFLKGEVGQRQPFPAAVSAQLAPQPAAVVAAAAAREADLGFLPAGGLAAARALALGVGMPRTGPEAALEAPVAGALAPLRAAVNAEDSAGAWLALAAFAVGQEVDDGSLRQALLSEATAAAVNAYLRAPDDATAAQAARGLAAALEASGEGRRSLDALRLAARLAPGPEVDAAVARAEGLYGFRVLDRQVEAEPADPRVCVEFSEELDPRGVDYADYVQVSDLATAPVVEAEGSRLCVSGLAHGASYALTLRAGLPSAAGETLRAPVRQEVYVRDRTPAARFLGRAYVLPKAADAAIPISTVNLDTVELKLFRVGARNLRSVIRSGDFGGALSAFEEGRLGSDVGVEVWSGAGDVGGELNRDVVTALPFGEVVAGLEPGLYALTARVPGAQREDWETLATQWFVLTDLGIGSLAGENGLHVFARSLASAAPVDGVTATLIARNNEVLGTAVTDASGQALFEPGLLRGRGGQEAALVTLEAGGDFAFLDLGGPGLDLSDRGVDGRPAPGPVDVFLSTERGAYRAGETVFATILARDSGGKAVEGLTLTAIVIRPDGVEHLRTALPDEGAGGRAFAMRLDPGAQRGGWRLAVYADPEAAPLASTGFLVEDFTPERLALELTAAEGPVDPAAGLAVTAQVDYLFGAPGAGLGIEGEAYVTPGRELAAYPGFRFGLDDEPFRSGYAALPPGVETDATGQARVTLDMPETWPTSRPLELAATIRAREGAGRPIERSLTRPVRPAGPLLGLRPLFDGAVDEGGTAGFEAVAVGPDLGRVALGPVDWTLSRVDVSFQWYEVDGNWSYETVTRRTRVANGSVEMGAEAPARLDLPVDWGRYELRLAAQGGPVAASLGFDAGWGAGAGAETPDFIELSLDRERYAPGEVARARIEARNPGRLLVAVMGDRLIDLREVTVDAAGPAVVDLPVTGEWGAGAYVVATLIRPMDAAARRNPARAVGVAWAAVDPGARRLAAVFDVPDAATPRTDMPVALRIEGLAPGATAYATIAAVDVGILNLTGFTSPDPVGWYFGQRRLGVEIRDVYGRLIDGMQGVAGRLRSGGDGGGALQGPPPTEELLATFSGVLTADASGVARTSVPLPDFNGTVRLMAVAWTAEGVGQAEKDVLVRDPVVVQAAMPRFLAPGDASRLRLDLAHAFGPPGAVTVRVTATDRALLPQGGASFAGEIADGGRLVFEAPLTAGLPGDDRLAIETVAPGGERLAQDLTLPVRANDPEIARQSRIALAPGQTLTLDAAVFDGLAPGTARATIAAGPLAEFDVPGLLTALEAYPWGCTEQVISRATPLLFFAETARALGLASGREADERIAEAIARVLANQTGAGGFGLWGPEDGDNWLDAYATDFLGRARALGHAVPDRAFAAALANLGNIVNAYGDFEKGGEDLAYALMVLAREGRASIGDLRYYADARAEAFATPLAQAQLGLALAQYGDQPRADAMFRLAGAGALAGEPEQLWRADFGSGLRDAAGVLALAAEAGSQAVDAAALAAIVTAPGPDRSPQEAVWSLLAAHALFEAASGGGTLSFNDVAVEGPAARVLEADVLGAEPLRVTNAGDAETLVVLTAFGVPTQPEPAGGNGYRIARDYFTLDGAPADPGRVALNDRLVAVVTVTPERDLEARLIVDDPLPAGFEIENPNLLRSGDPGRLAWLAADDVARHVEFRTDRFVAAVDWQGTEPFRLAYMVRAASPGSFHHPAASVEDMYRPAYRARTAPGRVEVSDARP